MISPDVVQGEMTKVSRVCRDLDRLAGIVSVAYLEAYEASLSKSGSSGIHANLGASSRNALSQSDITGDIAISGMHKRMRWQVLRAVRALRHPPYKPQSMIELLEEAQKCLEDAFLETDPEFREKLRRLRELEAAAEG